MPAIKKDRTISHLISGGVSLGKFVRQSITGIK